MTLYAALIYGEDLDWSLPENQSGLPEYAAFGQAAAEIIRGGDALYPTATATTVTVEGGKNGKVITSDGPFAETKEVLTGFYLLECADLDEAVSWAARIPGSWGGHVELRPVLRFG